MRARRATSSTWPSPSADNHLEGTQALPVSMLDNPRQAYTWPDTTDNRLDFVDGNWQHAIDAGSIVASNAYYRRISTSGVNSNVNGDYAPPDQPNEAFNLYTAATTRAWGASIQLTLQRALSGIAHQFVVGAAYDAGNTGFAQSGQPATFTPDRDTIGTGDYALQTNVATKNRSAGFYASDTMSLDSQWNLLVAGRYNGARVATEDLTGDTPAINGSNTYRRFNPAVGVTWTASPLANVFGGVNQGTRVPTAVELTCADPSAPCTLPNIFVADPPLKQVVATTFEAGVRGRAGADSFYSAALYRTDLDDDIQFIGAGNGAVNAGYFQNVGNTRRQGLELTGGTTLGEVHLVARYSLLDATFQTGFAESSPEQFDGQRAGPDLRAARRSAARTAPQRVPTARRLGAWSLRARRNARRVRCAIRARQREQRRSGRQGSRLCGRRDRCLVEPRAGVAPVRAHRQPVQPDIPEFRHPGRQLFPRTRQHVRCRSCRAGGVSLARGALRRLDRRPVPARPRCGEPLSFDDRKSPTIARIARPNLPPPHVARIGRARLGVGDASRAAGFARCPQPG